MSRSSNYTTEDGAHINNFRLAIKALSFTFARTSASPRAGVESVKAAIFAAEKNWTFIHWESNTDG